MKKIKHSSELEKGKSYILDGCRYLTFKSVKNELFEFSETIYNEETDIEEEKATYLTINEINHLEY